MVVERGGGDLGLFDAAHFDEGEALGPARSPLGHDGGFDDAAVGGEERRQIGVGGVVAEVPDIEAGRGRLDVGGRAAFALGVPACLPRGAGLACLARWSRRRLLLRARVVETEGDDLEELLQGGGLRSRLGGFAARLAGGVLGRTELVGSVRLALAAGAVGGGAAGAALAAAVAGAATAAAFAAGTRIAGIPAFAGGRVLHGNRQEFGYRSGDSASGLVRAGKSDCLSTGGRISGPGFGLP